MNAETHSTGSTSSLQASSGQAKTCQSCKNQFVIEPEDFNFYEKIKVPPPTWCPECRMIRRFVFRNTKNLFRRPEVRARKEVFSLFPRAVPAKIYELDFWNSDGWDPFEYGLDYDFSRPFFEQFREFLYNVPWPARSVINPVNSEYSDNFTDSRNSYLCFNGYSIENSAFVVGFNTVRESFDLNEARHTELSYDGYMIDECFRVFYSVNCEECTDVWFSRNLIGCTNCFGCVNLRNKQYHIFNKPYSKDAYKEYLSKLDFGSLKIIADLRKRASDFWLENPMRFVLAINVVNSTGEHIEHSKNLKYCYTVHEGENLRYCQSVESAQDSSDYTMWGTGASRMYECLSCGNQCDNMRSCWECWPSSRDIEYSMFCRSSSDLFGCVGLKKKQYCIFNKQYSKEEYFKLREKIIAHMNEMPYTDKQGRIYKYGEFFPPEFSPFAYNETIAQDFFPLTKEQAEAKGYLWREPETKEFKTTINAGDPAPEGRGSPLSAGVRRLPDNIKDVRDDILKEIIGCADCGKAYRIIEMELQFYRRIPLPLPRKCPECRFKDRFKFVNPPKFWPAKCQCGGTKSDSKRITNNSDKSSVISREAYANATAHPHGGAPCPNEFETSYAPESPAIIYCESCYNSEVA
jgi:hypothetical protein